MTHFLLCRAPLWLCAATIALQLLAPPTCAAANDYFFVTLAGSATKLGIRDGVGPVARFSASGGNVFPRGLAVDATGHIYIADGFNNVVRKITPPATVSTLAGRAGLYESGFADGMGEDGRFDSPRDVAVGPDGYVYVADSRNSSVRKISPQGWVTTLVAPREEGQDRLRSPTGIAVDRAGVVFVADTGNNAIRRITPDGVMMTWAGVAAEYNNSGADNGVGAAAKFNAPSGLAIDSHGNVFVADTSNHAIRKISPDRTVTTFAGRANNSFGQGAEDGTGSAARFRWPLDVAIGADDILYVADTGNHTIRRITPAGDVTTLAGAAGHASTVDAAGSAARFASPVGIAVDSAGALYVVEMQAGAVRKGIPSTAIPVAFASEPVDSTIWVEGLAKFDAIPIGQPELFNTRWQRAPAGTGAWTDLAESNTYFGTRTSTLVVKEVSAAMSGDRFRMIATTSAGGSATTRAATLTVVPAPVDYAFGVIEAVSSRPGPADGIGNGALFGRPELLAFGPDGNLYVADANSSQLRKVTRAGVVTTLPGPERGERVAGTNQVRVGFGAANSWDYLNLSHPGGVAIDSSGTFYVSDSQYHVIRKISPNGAADIIAGAVGQSGTDNGLRSIARFNGPTALALGSAGMLYVADTGNSAIRKITPAGMVTTHAGLAGESGKSDGNRTEARFNRPRGLVFDRAGNLVIADTENHTLRVLSPAGTVFTLAGIPGVRTTYDASTTFNRPSGLALGTDGSIFVADTGNSLIRQVTADGLITTLFGRFYGSYPVKGAADGSSSIASFSAPAGLAIDADGTLYVADTGNLVIRRISTSGEVSTLAGRAGGVYSPRTMGIAKDGALVVSGSVPGPVLRLSPQGVVGYIKDESSGDDAVAAAADGFIYVGGSNGTPLGTISPSGFFREVRSSPPNSFGFPRSVAVDENFNVFLADKLGPEIVKVRDYGETEHSIGSRWESGSLDGPSAAARFRNPAAIAVNRLGEVFVADATDHTIRKISEAGEVSTFAGQAGVSGNIDGKLNAARFNGPSGIAVDASGYIYVADTGNQTVRRITPAGQVTTIGGVKGGFGRLDGAGAEAQFSSPTGIAVDSLGAVYVGDTSHRVVIKGTPSPRKLTTPTITWAPAALPYGQALSAAQLNASANIPGTFTYTPPEGTVLRPGAATLRATFVPVDELAFTRVAVEERISVSTPTVRAASSWAVSPGANYSLSPSATGLASSATAEWRHNGQITGTSATWLTLTGVQPQHAGVYSAAITSGDLTFLVEPTIIGVATTEKVIGAGREIASDIFVAANGNTFDQILLEGSAATIRSDYAAGQITRVSFLDLNDDIVQVEFSGPGTLSIVLAESSGPGLPAKYNQSVAYMRGHAGIVVTGATEATNVSVFSVGKITAVNQGLFRPDVNYDGVADIAFIAILSQNGNFGGVRTANVHYFASQGITGIYAPSVHFMGPVNIGELTAYDAAVPVLVCARNSGETLITGGSLEQINGHPIEIAGFTRLRFSAGTDSHGNLQPAQANRGVLRQNSQIVTREIVQDP